MANGEPNKLVD